MASCTLATSLCSGTPCYLKVQLLSAEGALCNIPINNLTLAQQDVVRLDNSPAKCRRVIACYHSVTIIDKHALRRAFVVKPNNTQWCQSDGGLAQCSAVPVQTLIML